MLAKEQYAAKEVAKEQYAAKEVAKEQYASKEVTKEQHASKEVVKVQHSLKSAVRESVSKEPNKKYAKLSLSSRPHGPSVSHRMPEPPSDQTRPPHEMSVTQIPYHEGYVVLQYPIMWRGPLALKSTYVTVQMHLISGSSTVARASLPPVIDGTTSAIRIAQRMRLEITQLDAVYRKIQVKDKYSILLALPFGKNPVDLSEQSKNLKFRVIDYLFSKHAAGIINVSNAQQTAYVIHIFPVCDFIRNNFSRIAPNLLQILKGLAILVIIIIEV